MNVTIQMEEQPGLRFEQLAANPDNIAASHAEAKAILQDAISYSWGGIARVSPEAPLHEVYDPMLPTVGIDARNSFAGSELLGIANAQRADRKINVLYFDASSAGLSTAEEGGGKLYARRGFAIGPAGSLTTVELPFPVPIHAFESTDTEMTEYLKANGIRVLSDPVMAKRFEDKHSLIEIAEVGGIVTPERFKPEDLGPASDVVIKPADASQGRGVFFSSKYPGDVRQWLKYYDFLEAHEYAPVIEERIRPWPLYEPRTGQQIDWNVRSVLSQGEYLDMYVRAGVMDTAINKSAGAQTIAMDGLAKFVRRKSGTSTDTIIRALENASNDLAGAGSDVFVAGADILIDQHGRSVVFEVNAGNVGGLQTMAHMEQSIDGKLKNARRMLTALERSMTTGGIDVAEVHRPLPLSVAAKYDFIISDEDGRHIDLLFEENLNSEHVSRFLRTIILGHQLGRTVFTRSVETEELWKQLPPLELPMLRKAIPIYVMWDTRLHNLAKSYYESDPKSPQSNILMGYAAATKLDIDTVRDCYWFLNSSGKTRYRDELLELTLAGVLSYDKRFEQASKPVVEFARQMVAGTLEKARPARFAEIKRKALPKTMDAEDAERVESLMFMVSLINSDFESAAHYLKDPEALDDQAADVASGFIMNSIPRMLKREDGVRFLIEDAKDYVLGVSILEEARDNKDAVHVNAIAASLAERYCPNESDRAYFSGAIESALRGNGSELAQPDDDSAPQLLAYVAARCISGRCPSDVAMYLKTLRRLSPDLYNEADFLQDWAGAIAFREIESTAE